MEFFLIIPLVEHLDTLVIFAIEIYFLLYLEEYSKVLVTTYIWQECDHYLA
jgi:hypothetical protein